MMEPTKAAKNTRSACDRCYALKERCQRPATAATSPSPHVCTRCQRLGFVCETLRPVKRAGRPLAGRRTDVRGATSRRATRVRASGGGEEEQVQLQQSTTTNLHAFLGRLAPLTTEERDVLGTVFAASEGNSRKHGSSSFDPITILHQLVTAADDASMALLRDALLAYATATNQTHRSKDHFRSSHSSENLTMLTTHTDSVRYIAQAMASLRALPVRNAEDAALCYTVGSLIALSVYATVGLGVSRVCQYCLGATSSFVVPSSSSSSWRARSSRWSGDAGSGGNDDERRPLEGFMMLMEITDCIFWQRAPTPLRVMLGPGRPASSLESLTSPEGDASLRNEMIDWHLGLCLPLLPYYHRLCTISNTLAQVNTTPAQQSELFLQLDAIQKAIAPWQPPNLSQLLPTSSTNSLSTTEILHLLSQAKLYRLGILLFAHRLRHPFDVDRAHDMRADAWASEVFQELLTTVAVTGRAMRFVTLPLIMAGVEMRGVESRERALRAVDEGVDGENVARAVMEGVKRFLVKIWEERDARKAVMSGARSGGGEERGGGRDTRGMKWFESVNKPCPIVESVYEELGVMEVAAVC